MQDNAQQQDSLWSKEAEVRGNVGCVGGIKEESRSKAEDDHGADQRCQAISHGEPTQLKDAFQICEIV